VCCAGAVPAHHEETAGVDLPGGGWLPPHTARDAAAVIGLTWLRRRHTYQPGTPLPSAPVIPVAATVAATYASDGDPGPIPSDRLPPGVTIFTGPGAADAARGLLVTALLAGAHTTPATHIVITAADLHTLLGGGRIPDRLPGLHITDHPDRTARHLTGGPDGTVVQLRYAGPPDQTSSPVVVIAPDAAAAAGRVWTIAADGTHAGDGDTAPGRLCVVPPQTTNDLLTLAAAANRTTTENAATPGITETASTVRLRPGAASTASARLQVLGACRLVIAGQPVPIRRTAAWQVLVLLAAHPDGATGRQLTEAIWPGLPPATITGRLYTTLAALRGETRNAVGGDDPIIHSHGRYLLNPQVVTCDLWHLHHAIAQASAALSTSQQHTAYRAVIAAHRGELAAGHDWPWLHPLREALTAHVLTAYSTLAAASPPAEAIALLSDAMTVDPYNDAVHRLAFQHLNDAGDHAAATALHDAYARRLATVRLTPTPRWTDDSPTEQRGSSQQR
jgi:DNA-binding SARP family transcriptional activator